MNVENRRKNEQEKVTKIYRGKCKGYMLPLVNSFVGCAYLYEMLWRLF